MTFAIFGNTYKSQTIVEVQHVLEYLKAKEVRVLLSQELRHELNLLRDYDAFDDQTEENVDFALSIGGDGTYLTTASIVANKGIPILGINSGHLGFLTDATTNDVENIINQLLAGDYQLEDRSVLQVVTKGGGHILYPFALNEVAVMKQEISSMISVETAINGEHLHTYKADGLIISTPTGSTAYNLSVGGPVMSPNVRAFILSPIATHTLHVRPLVVPDDRQIDMTIRSRSGSYLISIDGRSQTLKEEVQLEVSRAPFSVRLVRLSNHHFIQTLRDKLYWGK